MSGSAARMILVTGHGEYDWRFVPKHTGYSLNAFKCNDAANNNNNTNDNGVNDNDNDDNNAVQRITS